MHLVTLDLQIKQHKIIEKFKDGVADAILHGSRNDDETHHYYKKGYDYGISLYAELMVNNDFFKEKRKK